MRQKDLEVTAKKIKQEVLRLKESLHHRPWRKHRDGCAWFIGASGLGGNAPAYRVFEANQQWLDEFDRGCEHLLASGSLQYRGPALEDRGAIYDFRAGGRG